MQRTVLISVLSVATFTSPAVAVEVFFFDDKATFDAITATTTIDFEGLAPDNGFFPPPPIGGLDMLTVDGIPFSVPPGGLSTFIVVAGANAPLSGNPFNSAILATSTVPVTADLSAVAGGVTAMGAFFGNYGIESPLVPTMLTLVGTGGVLDQRTVRAPDLGAGNPREFYGWIVQGDTIQSVTHNLIGNFDGIDDFQHGNLLPGATPNQMELNVTYSTESIVSGPLSFGLSVLPSQVQAQFVLESLGGVAGHFDESSVVSARIEFGDGVWTEQDLDTFSMSFDFDEQLSLFEVNTLDYAFLPIDTPTVTDTPVLNNSFELHITGTDTASGQPFEYLYEDSAQTLAPLSTADADGDGDVDGRDFLLIQRNDPALIPQWETEYGTGVGPLASSQAVPEPASIALLGLAGTLFFSRCGRNFCVPGPG